MNNKIKIILWIFGFILFIILAGLAYNILSKNFDSKENTLQNSEQDAISSSSEEMKYVAPDFSIEAQDGQPVKLSDYIGKPVIINFWASWCPPCKAEMPDFEEVYQQEKDEVVFLMINMTDGQRETKEKANNYIQKEQFHFPIYYDTAGDAANTYGVYSIPSTLFIDKEGYIVGAYQGAINKKILLSNLEKIKQ